MLLGSIRLLTDRLCILWLHSYHLCAKMSFDRYFLEILADISYSRSGEDLNEVILLEIFPAVDLEIAVALIDLRLDGLLLCGNSELLLVDRVAIRRVRDEADFGDLAAAILPLEVEDHPSVYYVRIVQK